MTYLALSVFFYKPYGTYQEGVACCACIDLTQLEPTRVSAPYVILRENLPAVSLCTMLKLPHHPLPCAQPPRCLTASRGRCRSSHSFLEGKPPARAGGALGEEVAPPLKIIEAPGHVSRWRDFLLLLLLLLLGGGGRAVRDFRQLGRDKRRAACRRQPSRGRATSLGRKAICSCVRSVLPYRQAFFRCERLLRVGGAVGGWTHGPMTFHQWLPRPGPPSEASSVPEWPGRQYQDGV